jgi:hypothetical protein
MSECLLIIMNRESESVGSIEFAKHFFFCFSRTMPRKKGKHTYAVGLRQVVLSLIIVLKAAGHDNAGETGSGQRENASNDILNINIDRRGAEDSHSQPNTWRRVQGEN